MDYKVFVPVLIAFVLSVIMGPLIIPVLRKLKMGQTEREDGVKSHLKKAGTPTMGGVIILLSVVITAVFYIKDYPKIIPILFEAEDGASDCCDCGVCILYGAVYRRVAGYAAAVYRRKILERRVACDSRYVFCCDRNCQRSEFYRRAGWSGFQCDRVGCYVLYGSSDRDKKRHRTHHLRSGRCIAWFSSF